MQPISDEPQRLEYATRDAARPNRAGKVCLVIAYLCSGVPMVVGVGTLLLFWITRWDVLPAVGFLTIFGGLGLLFVGVGCLIAYVSIERRAKVLDRRTMNRRSRWAVLGLLVNLPLGFGCAVVGYSLMTQYRVTVVNQTDSPIASGVLEYPGGEVSFGRLAPGDGKRVVFSAVDNGASALVLIKPDGSTSSREVDVYLYGTGGGDQEWTINPDGGVTVTYK